MGILHPFAAFVGLYLASILASGFNPSGPGARFLAREATPSFLGPTAIQTHWNLFGRSTATVSMSDERLDEEVPVVGLFPNSESSNNQTPVIESFIAANDEEADEDEIVVMEEDDVDPLIVEALETKRQLLGPLHPETLTAMSNYASHLVDLGRHHEAESLQSGVLNLRRQILGPEHPDTILSIRQYAATLSELRRQSEALSLLKEVCNLTQAIFGPTHKATLTAEKEYADTQEQGFIRREQQPSVILKDEKALLLEAGKGFTHAAWFLSPPHVRQYFAAIAAKIRSLWPADTEAPRVLILGLGGGVIAGGLLTHPQRPVEEVYSIEFDQRVIDLAQERFFPVIFSGGSEAQATKHHIIHGDAFDTAALVQKAQLAPFDFIVEDFTAYIHRGRSPPGFWKDLQSAVKPAGTLIVNTHFECSEDLDTLRAALCASQWSNLEVEKVYRNWNYPPHFDEHWLPGEFESWEAEANILVTARAPNPRIE